MPTLSAERREYHREYFWKHRCYCRLGARERAHLIRLEALIHYSNGGLVCNNCGEADIDVLQLDHINGGGNRELKKLGIKGNLFYLWLKRNDYPEGYQVLCANCNMRKARLRRERQIDLTGTCKK